MKRICKSNSKAFEERVDVIFAKMIYYYSLSIGTLKCLHHFKVRTVIHVMADL